MSLRRTARFVTPRPAGAEDAAAPAEPAEPTVPAEAAAAAEPHQATGSSAASRALEMGRILFMSDTSLTRQPG